MLRIIILSLIISCGRQSRIATISTPQNLNTAIAVGDYQYIVNNAPNANTKVGKGFETSPLMDIFLNYSDIESEEETQNRLNAIEALLKNPNNNIDFRSKDDQSTCLSIAVKNNDTDGVKLLLKYNANTNLQYLPYQQTALMMAISRGYDEISRVLYPLTELSIKDNLDLNHLELATKVKNTNYLNFLRGKNNLKPTPPGDF